MTYQVRIYCRSKSATQSGRDKSRDWILEAELTTAQSPEPIMGWTQSGDTMNQVRMEFPSKDSAETFAKNQGWRYTTDQTNVRRVKPRNYGDNFVYRHTDKT